MLLTNRVCGEIGNPTTSTIFNYGCVAQLNSASGFYPLG